MVFILDIYLIFPIIISQQRFVCSSASHQEIINHWCQGYCVRSWWREKMFQQSEKQRNYKEKKVIILYCVVCIRGYVCVPSPGEVVVVLPSVVGVFFWGGGRCQALTPPASQALSPPLPSLIHSAALWLRRRPTSSWLCRSQDLSGTSLCWTPSGSFLTCPVFVSCGVRSRGWNGSQGFAGRGSRPPVRTDPLSDSGEHPGSIRGGRERGCQGDDPASLLRRVQRGVNPDRPGGYPQSSPDTMTLHTLALCGGLFSVVACRRILSGVWQLFTTVANWKNTRFISDFKKSEKVDNWTYFPQKSPLCRFPVSGVPPSHTDHRLLLLLIGHMTMKVF